VERTVYSELVVENPGTTPSMSQRSRSVMAGHSQSISQATVEGEREGVLELRTQGLGVTEAALDVFNNFVYHIATNADPTSAAPEKTLPSKVQLRRSKRFDPREEAPKQCPQMLPTAPQQHVRLLACLPCVDA
jgi:hypothetical protein